MRGSSRPMSAEFLSLRDATTNHGVVFPEAVTDATRRKDFERAGIEPDDQGRVADLHALRTTLGTMLAREGVAPQIAQRIMRHSDYRTTLAYYTDLTVTDAAAAVGRLPIARGASDTPDNKHQHHQQKHQQSTRGSPHSDTRPCKPSPTNRTATPRHKPSDINGVRTSPQRETAACDKAGDRSRTGDIQLGKLTFYH